MFTSFTDLGKNWNPPLSGGGFLIEHPAHSRDLIRYGREHCRLNDRDCRKVIQDVIGAVTETGKTIPKEIEEHPGSEHVLNAMAHCWNDAVKSLYFKKDGQKADCKTELDYVVADLTDRYGDPYRNQKDRDERVRTMRAESPLAGMTARSAT